MDSVDNINLDDLEGTFQPLDVKKMLHSIADEDDLKQVVVFGIPGDGRVNIYASHSTPETDNLITDGVHEWGKVLDGTFNDDEE